MNAMDKAVEAVKKQIDGSDHQMLMVIACLMRHPQFPELLLKAYRVWNTPTQGTDMATVQREAKELQHALADVMNAISGHVAEHAKQVAYTQSAVALLRTPVEGQPN